MRHQIAALADSGEPVAALWASEPGIYGRFGYGVASRKAVVTVPRPVHSAAPTTTGMTVVLSDVGDGLAGCVDVYDRVRPNRPGMVSRSAKAWFEASLDEPDSRGGASPLRCARAVDDDGRNQGYSWFRTRPDWSSASPEGTVTVTEMLAASPQAARALQDVVFDLDLMTSTEVWNLPLDDPLLMWGHSRRLRPAIDEQLWVRLVRLEEALVARRYCRAGRPGARGARRPHRRQRGPVAACRRRDRRRGEPDGSTGRRHRRRRRPGWWLSRGRPPAPGHHRRSDIRTDAGRSLAAGSRTAR